MKPKTAPNNSNDLLNLTTAITCSFVAYNSLRVSEIKDLITTVYIKLGNLSDLYIQYEMESPIGEMSPAVEIKRSVLKECIICLEDGKKFRSLKRHLWAAHGLSVEQYRKKWDLPRSYPIVAPNYSAKRAQLAIKNGLGRQKKNSSGTYPTG